MKSNFDPRDLNSVPTNNGEFYPGEFDSIDILAKPTPIKENDNVNHPSHYTSGGIECIDAIRASMSIEEFRGHLKGCAMKYLWRYQMKGGLEDLEKANVYLGWLRESLRNAEGKH